MASASFFIIEGNLEHAQSSKKEAEIMAEKCELVDMSNDAFFLTGGRRNASVRGTFLRPRKRRNLLATTRI